MPNASFPPNEHFWLLLGEVPTGPFTVAQIHAQLATGDATWQTPACPVGASTWLPLLRVRGIGPAPPEAKPSAGEPTERTAPEPFPPPQPYSTDPRAPNRVPPPPLPVVPDPPNAPAGSSEPVPADPRSELIGVGIGIGTLVLLIAGVGYGGYWTWEQLRPLTATEVCQKLDGAGTAAEAKKYVTPRLHAFIDAENANGWRVDPNDRFESAREADGPQPGAKLVGFRGSFFLPEAGRRVSMEGHCKLVKSDGWKVDDVIVTGVEGAALPGPVSLVDEYLRSLSPPTGRAPPEPSARPNRPGPPARLPAPAPVARQKTKWEEVFIRLKDAVGWGGIVVLVALVLVGLGVYHAPRKKPPLAS